MVVHSGGARTVSSGDGNICCPLHIRHSELTVDLKTTLNLMGTLSLGFGSEICVMRRNRN